MFLEVNIIDTGVRSAQENMAIDKLLLDELNPKQLPILHLYQWEKDSITYGYFAQPEQLLDIKGIQKRKIDLAKRITGGGATMHFCDYAFSFLMPAAHCDYSENTLDNYQFVNSFVMKAAAGLVEQKEELVYLQEESKGPIVRHLNYCMAKPTKYDVIYKGKKIGGAAQRKTSKGYLHHGTISIALPDPQFLRSILQSEEACQAILKNSFGFIENHLDQKKLNKYRAIIQEKLIEAILKS